MSGLYENLGFIIQHRISGYLGYIVYGYTTALMLAVPWVQNSAPIPFYGNLISDKPANPINTSHTDSNFETATVPGTEVEAKSIKLPVILAPNTPPSGIFDYPDIFCCLKYPSPNRTIIEPTRTFANCIHPTVSIVVQTPSADTGSSFIYSISLSLLVLILGGFFLIQNARASKYGPVNVPQEIIVVATQPEVASTATQTDDITINVAGTGTQTDDITIEGASIATQTDDTGDFAFELEKLRQQFQEQSVKTAALREQVREQARWQEARLHELKQKAAILPPGSPSLAAASSPPPPSSLVFVAPPLPSPLRFQNPQSAAPDPFSSPFAASPPADLDFQPPPLPAKPRKRPTRRGGMKARKAGGQAALLPVEDAEKK